MIIKCDNKGCTGEAVIKNIDYVPGTKPVKGIGPITVWYYGRWIGQHHHIVVDRIRVEAGPLHGMCPECRDRKPEGEQ